MTSGSAIPGEPAPEASRGLEVIDSGMDVGRWRRRAFMVDQRPEAAPESVGCPPAPAKLPSRKQGPGHMGGSVG